MKKLLLFTTGFALISSGVAAQIPNNGFETWTQVGNYMDPQGYLTPNSSAVSVYPVTRSTDHYPTSLGSYSMRLENQPALLPNADALGLVLQNGDNVLMNGPGPAFPVTGHPTSLTGYYKFLPMGGDTMRIQAMLFLNGNEVSYGVLTSTVTAGNWTSFTIPFSNYTTADSCSIMISSYNADGPPPAFVPHGNSVLYVDNLNFDVLLTGIDEENALTPSVNVYPNPATDFITLDLSRVNNAGATVNIYNCVGELVHSELVFDSAPVIDVAELQNGAYFLDVITEEGTLHQKIVIQR